MQPGPSLACELWMDVLGQLTTFILHDLRNEMQGVSVNLEVLRSRAELGTETAKLLPYARNAAREFESLSARVEALAYLAREPEGAPELGAILDVFAALLGGEGRVVRVRHETGSSLVEVSHAAARLFLASCILQGARAEATVHCQVKRSGGLSVRMTIEPPMNLSVDPQVARVAALTFTRIEQNGGELTITFPTKAGTDSVLV